MKKSIICEKSEQVYQCMLKISSETKNGNSLVVEIKYNEQERAIDFKKDSLDGLRNVCGVYAFIVERDEDRVLLYIGKSNNLKTRLLQHLTNTTKNGELRKTTNKSKYNELFAILEKNRKDNFKILIYKLQDVDKDESKLIISIIEILLINSASKHFLKQKEDMKLNFEFLNTRDP